MDTLDFLSSSPPSSTHQLSPSQFSAFEPHFDSFDTFQRDFDDEFESVQDDEDMMSMDDEDYEMDLIQLNKVEILNYQNASNPTWDQLRIHNPFLQLGDASTPNQSFGLIYEDSYSASKAFVPFFRDSIVAIIRQVDVSHSSAYIVFNQFLATRDYGANSQYAASPSSDSFDHLSQGDSDSQKEWQTTSAQKLQAWIKKQQEAQEQQQREQYTLDFNSPLRHCMALILHFTHEKSIPTLFAYVRENLPSLRTIHAGWMFAHEDLTNRDVQLIGLKYDVMSNRAPGVDVTYSERKANVMEHDDEDASDDEKSSDPAVGIIRFSPKKSRSEPILSGTKKISPSGITRRRQNRKRQRTIENSPTMRRPSLIQHEVALLDKSLALLLLPHAFSKMVKPLQSRIATYLQQDRISFFQLTNGLCEVLALAHSKYEIQNALSVIHALSQNPNVQLKNLDAVRTFVLGTSDKEEPFEERIMRTTPVEPEVEHTVEDAPQENNVFDLNPHTDIELQETPPQEKTSLLARTNSTTLAQKRSFPNLELPSDVVTSRAPLHQETVYVVHNIYPHTPSQLYSSAPATQHTGILSDPMRAQSYSTGRVRRRTISPPPVTEELKSRILNGDQEEEWELVDMSEVAGCDPSGKVCTTQIIHHHHYHYAVPATGAQIHYEESHVRRRPFWRRLLCLG